MGQMRQSLIAMGVTVMMVAVGAAALAADGGEAPEVLEIATDTDGDGLSDTEEVDIHNTDPLNDDTDDDGLLDGEEVNTHNTDPLNDDTDDDGVLDGDEVNVLETDPNETDSDSGATEVDESGNEVTDADEDLDGDGLSNADELYVYGTDPLVPNELVEAGECEVTFDGMVLTVGFEGEIMTFDLSTEMTGKKLNHGRVVSTVARRAPKECHGEIVSAVAQTDWGKTEDAAPKESSDELLSEEPANGLEESTSSGPGRSDDAKKDKGPKKNR